MLKNILVDGYYDWLCQGVFCMQKGVVTCKNNRQNLVLKNKLSSNIIISYIFVCLKTKTKICFSLLKIEIHFGQC
jgi:hypothetical protein